MCVLNHSSGREVCFLFLFSPFMTQQQRTANGEAIIQRRVFLVDIVDKSTKPDILKDRMKELKSLVETYGGIVILDEYQKKDTPDPKTYI